MGQPQERLTEEQQYFLMHCDLLNRARREISAIIHLALIYNSPFHHLLPQLTPKFARHECTEECTHPVFNFRPPGKSEDVGHITPWQKYNTISAQ
jgi:hypothetical protein